MDRPPFDPRRVCNLVLDEAARFDLRLGNLALQKLLYFAHGRHLVMTGERLVSGYFEAWRHGPVHPVAYEAFKQAGALPIDFSGQRRDPLTGAPARLPAIEEPDTRRLVCGIVLSLADLPPGRLVEIAHARGAPWDLVVRQAQSRVTFGLRIPDRLILDHFQRHMIGLDAEHEAGEPRDDGPLVA